MRQNLLLCNIYILEQFYETDRAQGIFEVWKSGEDFPSFWKPGPKSGPKSRTMDWTWRIRTDDPAAVVDESLRFL